MRHINLLVAQAPQKFTLKAPKREDSVFLAVLLAAALCAAHYGYSLKKTRAQAAELTKARTQLEEITVSLAPLKDSATAFEARRLKQQEVQAIVERKAGWSGRFREFSSALPGGVWLTAMASSRVDGKLRFTLKGQSPSNRKIASFLDQLEQIPHASGVTLNYAEREPNSDPELYRFEMSVPLNAEKVKAP